MNDRFTLHSLINDAAHEALADKNLEIFIARYGFTRGGRKTSYDELAARHGITRDRIRQIIIKSLNRIRWKASRQLRAEIMDGASAKLFVMLHNTIDTVTPQSVLQACERYGHPNDEWMAYIFVHLLVQSPDVKRNLMARIRHEIQQRRLSAPTQPTEIGVKI
jgi:hypothetical protein